MKPPHGEPASLPRIHISRPRLVEKLTRAIRCKLTVVHADAGYGKTTAVAEFTHSVGLRTEWYPLTPVDRDIALLSEGLEGCLRRLASGPEPRGPGRGEVRHRMTPGATLLGEMLLGQAARVGPEIALLVLDDYQNVDQEDGANLLIGALIEGCPSCLHFLVLSRSVPRFPFARLMVRQEITVLQQEDLAFTLEETGRLLRDESGFDLDDAAIALVQERTEGWAAGIAMVLHSLRYGRQDRTMAILADPVASTWLVYRYLAEEVFDRQGPAIQDFLVRTSVLTSMSAPSCDWLLETTNSSLPILLTLEESGLFTTSVGPARLIFRYHQLFREFLRQKLYQREGREAVESLHFRAARFYERREAWEDCVHQYLKAGKPLEAARVVEAVGERHIFSGLSRTVEYWLQALPEDLTATRPWLLALKGRLSHLATRHEEAIRLLERALEHFRAGGDGAGQAWTVGEIAYAEYRLGRLQQSIRHYASALSMAKAGSMLRSQLLVMQAMAYREVGLLEDSLRAGLASIQELAAVEDEYCRLWGQSRATRNLAHTRMEMGDVAAARGAARQSLASCVDHDLGEYEQSWALMALGTVLWGSGDFQESMDALHRALGLAGRHIVCLRHKLHLWLGNSLRDSGRYAEADRSYAQSPGPAELERLLLAVVAGRSPATRTAAVDLHRQYCLSESITERGAAEVVLAAALREAREPEEALEHVREGARLLGSHGYRLRLASALLHQARLEYELSRHLEARESLAQAFHLAAAGGYHHFFWWDPALVAFLCQKALARGIYPDYAADLAVRRLDAASGAILASLVHHPSAEVRHRGGRVLASLSRPTGEPASPWAAVLAECADPEARERISRAIADGLISPEGVRILRSRRGLSWREVEIFVEYYLRPAALLAARYAPLREECAQRLNISENTVRSHVRRIRDKLALPAWVTGGQVLDWAEQEGLRSSPGRPLDRPPAPPLPTSGPDRPLA